MEDPQTVPEIIVSWKKEKFNLRFDEESTLKDLKEQLKNITGVPVNGQKLVFSGAVMKDETATLSSLGIHPSSKILLMGTIPNQNELAQTSTGSSEEHALVTRISQSLEKTKNALIPQIESFESSVNSFLASTPHDIKVRQKLTDTHHFIVESLMQSLLSLDSVDCPIEFATARQKRREAVKFTQGLIDRVDSVNEQLAARTSSPLL